MKITASTAIQNCTQLSDVQRFTGAALTQIVSAVNGNLTTKDNLSFNVISFAFTAAGKELGVPHGLGSAPTGYMIVGTAATLAPAIYDGITATDATTLYLRATAAGTVRVGVFL